MCLAAYDECAGWELMSNSPNFCQFLLKLIFTKMNFDELFVINSIRFLKIIFLNL